MNPSFHLSLGVNSLEDSVHFFVHTMKAKVVHRDPSGYINIDFHGTQITLKSNPDIKPPFPDFHFGVNLELSEFDKLNQAILASGYTGTITSPKVIDAGAPMERKKMYVVCPTGYLIEIKGYRF